MRAIPDAVDQYRLIRPLGSGGSGIVFEGTASRTARQVAIKLIPNNLAFGELSPSIPEARFARLVKHPHVVTLYDTGTYPDGVYLVMELVRGRSLQSYLAEGHLDWREATAILADACAGVTAVHACGIVHGDIKPANLLRAADGRVKLTDFGLARWLIPSNGSALFQPVAGTPHFMSPEQCRREELDERTDIYSLGASYFLLLTGQTPFTGVAAMRILFEHCATPAPDPRNIQKEVPQACAKIVMRAMAKKRVDRFHSAREMGEALRTALQGRSTAWRISDNHAKAWLSSRRTGR